MKAVVDWVKKQPEELTREDIKDIIEDDEKETILRDVLFTKIGPDGWE